MLLEDKIKELNSLIAIDESVKTYGLAERLTVDKKTILAEVGSDNQIAIDNDYNAIGWHRLLSVSYEPYEGRGIVNQVKAKYSVRLLCYSKNLGFADFIASKIASNNELELKGGAFDKETTLKQELPEALRNFDINQYFFAFNYEFKAVLDGRCFDKFCF